MKDQQERPKTRRELRAEILARRENRDANFRRGEAISGYKKEQSERAKSKKLAIRRRKISFFLSVLAFLSIFIFIFLGQFIASFSVSKADQNNVNLEGERYSKIINDYFTERPIERVVSFLNKKELIKKLQSSTPEVKNIEDISITGISKYKFKILFREPVASWVVEGKTLYVDSDGVAFEKNLSAKEPEISVHDESGISIKDGKTVASSSFLSFIGKVISASRKNNIHITHVRIPPLSLRQVELKVEGLNYIIKLSSSDSAEGQIANLRKAIDYFNKHHTTLKYLDLRVEGRGYYK